VILGELLAIVMLLIIALPLMFMGSLMSAPFRTIKRPRPRSRLR
jgi:hypothetical protein